MTPIWIVGAGGHAKVVIDAVRASGAGPIAGVLDDDPAARGRLVLGVAVVDDASAAAVARHGVRRAVLAVGDNRAREALARRLGGDRVAWPVVVHPRAHLAPGVRVGPGCVVLAGAVVQPDAVVGEHVIINTSSSVDHDCELGGFAHVGPGARLAGGVRVGAGALLGIGCVVLPGRAVGAGATIGGGAVVVADIPAGATARGVPARH
jgi:UDP-perosamine 4-acetyltransferase